MPNIDDILREEVTAKLVGTYDPTKTGDLSARTNLDPFGSLTTVTGPTLGKYDFDTMKPNQSVDFFEKMDLLGSDTVPDSTTIPPGSLNEDDGTVHQGIPRIQHSIWVGQPLNGDSEKKKAFMAQLVKNKNENPGWNVVLWTDQPRERFHKVPLDPDIVEMQKWAKDNGIKLASIDEIYGNKDNEMQLQFERRMEQNKSGTGRAAASDIIRLEVLHRFGGLYVDGDKPFKVPLDNVLEQAAGAKIKIKGVGPEKSGFASAQDLAGPQNCSICSAKGSEVTKAMLDKVQEEYGKDRLHLTSGATGMPLHDVWRAQRSEVIARSGPTIISSIAQGQGLMTMETIQAYTGTTSWSQEEKYQGYNRPKTLGDLSVTGQARVDNDIAIQGIKDGAPKLPKLPTGDLTKDQQERIGRAVRGGLTALAYTTSNEIGKLDLKHLQPHLDDPKHKLTPEEKQIALHATLKALGSDDFKGIRESVTSYSIPKELRITEESMDLLTNTGNFPNLKSDDLAVQRAALRGDVALLEDLRARGVSLTNKSTLTFDVGTHEDVAGMAGAVAMSGKMTPLMAAVHGGQSEAVKFLMAHSHSGGFSQDELKDQMEALNLAGRQGQTSLMTTIAEVAAHNIQSIVDDTERAKQMEVLNKGIAKAVGSLRSSLEDTKRQEPPVLEIEQLFDKLPSTGDYTQLGQGAGPLHLKDNRELAIQLKADGLSDDDIKRIEKLVTPNDLKGGLVKALTDGPVAKNLREQIVQKQEGGEQVINLLKRLDTVPSLKEGVKLATPDAFTNMMYKRNLEGVKKMVDEGFDVTDCDDPTKQQVTDTLVRTLGNNRETLEVGKSMGLGEDAILMSAGRQNKPELITEYLNSKRDVGEQIAVGDYDKEAQLAVAHAKFPNSEAGKNDYKNVDVTQLSVDQARELAQKAMVYSHDRLREGIKGDKSRVQGWNDLLESMKTQPNLQGDQTLKDMIDQTKNQLSGMRVKSQTVRDQLQVQANSVDSPDLSQRQATSRGGKIREFFKANPTPTKSPDDHTFVPGKGMKKV